MKKLQKIKKLLEPFGPFLEAPSLRHTERLADAAFTEKQNHPRMIDFESIFRTISRNLRRTIPADETLTMLETRAGSEALKRFNSDHYQNEREEKTLAKFNPYVALPDFKSLLFQKKTTRNI